MSIFNFGFPVLIAGTFCPGTWDGWLCWDDTLAGQSARAPCPEFKTGFDPARKLNYFVFFRRSQFL